MKLSPGFLSTVILLAACLTPALAQNLPGSLDFTTQGAFTNGSPDSDSSILLADNDLSNGYEPGFDLTDAPTDLNPTGPDGSAAFQWGRAANVANYKHTSALWFQPLAVSGAIPEKSFDLGYLYYRNGTIDSRTGAGWVDIALTVSFAQPLGIDPLSVTFGTALVNSLNTQDPVASADIVSLRDLAVPVNFTDDFGHRYFLELTFEVDQDTIDGTLSSQDEFRVFEGGQGRATLVGRFTVDPLTPASIPEPSSALICSLGLLALLRRKR